MALFHRTPPKEIAPDKAKEEYFIKMLRHDFEKAKSMHTHSLLHPRAALHHKSERFHILPKGMKNDHPSQLHTDGYIEIDTPDHMLLCRIINTISPDYMSQGLQFADLDFEIDKRVDKDGIVRTHAHPVLIIRY